MLVPLSRKVIPRKAFSVNDEAETIKGSPRAGALKMEISSGDEKA
jgi:hypothetical protein